MKTLLILKPINDQGLIVSGQPEHENNVSSVKGNQVNLPGGEAKQPSQFVNRTR